VSHLTESEDQFNRTQMHILSAYGVTARAKNKAKYLKIGADYQLTPPPKIRRKLYMLLIEKYGDVTAKQMMKMRHIPIPKSLTHSRSRSRRQRPMTEEQWLKQEERLYREQQALFYGPPPPIDLPCNAPKEDLSSPWD
jgi:hypothetical protein